MIQRPNFLAQALMGNQFQGMNTMAGLGNQIGNAAAGANMMSSANSQARMPFNLGMAQIGAQRGMQQDQLSFSREQQEATRRDRQERFSMLAKMLGPMLGMGGGASGMMGGGLRGFQDSQSGIRASLPGY